MKKQKINNKFKLELILRITQAINQNLSVEDLLQKYEKLLFNELQIGKVVVFQKREHWENLLVSGVPENILNSIDAVSDLAEIKEITYISTDSLPQLQPFDFIIPVFQEDIILAYVLIGDFDEEGEGMSPAIKHLRFIQTISNIIIVAIKNKHLQKQLLKQEAIKKEIELASKIQSLLIPHDNLLPRNKYVTAKGFYQPHLEIGGDYYDFIELDGSELVFCVGDVAGKGIPAALIMANFQAQVRALYQSSLPLKELITELNKKISENSIAEKFITFFIGIYNYKSRKLQYINASHHPPVLFDMKENSVTRLTSGCIGLGMLDEIPFINVGEAEIKNHSKIICFTDGLVELKQENNVVLEVDSVTEMISNNDSLDRNFSNLVSYAEKCIAEDRVSDDIAIIGIEFFN